MPEAPELAYSRDCLKRIVEGKFILDIKPATSGRYSAKPPAGYEEFRGKLGITPR